MTFFLPTIWSSASKFFWFLLTFLSLSINQFLSQAIKFYWEKKKKRLWGSVGKLCICTVLCISYRSVDFDFKAYLVSELFSLPTYHSQPNPSPAHFDIRPRSFQTGLPALASTLFPYFIPRKESRVLLLKNMSNPNPLVLLCSGLYIFSYFKWILLTQSFRRTQGLSSALSWLHLLHLCVIHSAWTTQAGLPSFKLIKGRDSPQVIMWCIPNELLASVAFL